MPDSSFDAVVTLCAIEHFGLGRYGDKFDLEADRAAVKEMIRVLRPGGYLIITTNITRAHPSIVFNAHRIYDQSMLHDYLSALQPVEESYLDPQTNERLSFRRITATPGEWNLYMGCWRKT